MFRDCGKFSAHFIEGDVHYPNAELLALRRTIDIISIMHVLHQWTWDDQVSALKQLVPLSRPRALLVGFQVGATKGNLWKSFISKENPIGMIQNHSVGCGIRLRRKLEQSGRVRLRLGLMRK
jgi:hypothetical protein